MAADPTKVQKQGSHICVLSQHYSETKSEVEAEPEETSPAQLEGSAMELRDKERCCAACVRDRVCTRGFDTVLGRLLYWDAYSPTRVNKGYEPTDAHDISCSERPKIMRDEEAQAMYVQNHEILCELLTIPQPFTSRFDRRNPSHSASGIKVR